MTRKVQSILFVLVLLMSVFAGLSIVLLPKVQAELNPPHDDGSGNGDTTGGDGIYATDGDWVIEAADNLVYSSTLGHYIIIVNGHLIVQPGSSLTLENVTLQMNCGFNGEFNITVESDGAQGGTLIIKDLDGDPQTTVDASVITSYTPDGSHRFGFIVNGPHGDLKMNNSELHECGWDSGDSDWLDSGLNIQGSNAFLTGNEISNNFRGLILHNTSAVGARIENNTVHDNQATGLWISNGSTNNHIANNEIYSNEFGIFISNSTNLVKNYIIANSIHTNQFHGIRLEHSLNFHIEKNDIHDNLQYGFFIDGSSNMDIIDNDIFGNSIIGIHLEGSSDMLINSNFIRDNSYIGIRTTGNNRIDIQGNEIWNHTGDTGIQVWDSQNIIVDNNHLDDNGGNGFDQWDSSIYSENSSDVVISDNQVNNSNYFGMFILDQPNIVVENNKIENTLDLASVLVFRDITNKGSINNNTILNSGYHAIFVESCYNMKLTNNTIDDVITEGGMGIVNQVGISMLPLKVYIHKNNITNIGSGQKGIGISLRGGSDHVVDGNRINTITSHGIFEDTKDSLFKNNVISNVGTTLSANSNEDVSGFSMEGDNNILINNTISHCQSPAGVNYVSGLQFGYSSGSDFAENTTIKNCKFIGNEINVRAADSDGVVDDILIENSTFTADADTVYDFYLTMFSHITTLNSSFDNSSTEVDSTSTLAVKWYLHVKVLDSGVGRNLAEVWLKDSTGSPDPSTGQPFTTQNIDGQDGWVKWIPVTQYIESDNTKQYYTPHTVNATYGTKDGFAYPNVWQSMTVTINLGEIPQVEDIQVGSNVVFRGETIYIFLNASDGEDWESELTVEFQYRDPNDIFWNTTYLGPSIYFDSNGNPNDNIGYWYVAFTPPVDAILGFYDFRGRVQDTDGSWSPWVTLFNSVDVRNNLPYVTAMYNTSNSTGHLYRGDDARISASGDDVEDGDNLPEVEFEYRRPGSSWGTHTAYWVGPPSMDAGDWYIVFKPVNSIDTPTGVYGFRARFKDNDNEWGPWAHMENLTVLNNPPWLVGFYKQAGSVYRGGTVRVYADPGDIEEMESDLLVHFYYKHVADIAWSDVWLTSNGQWDGISFYADFNPPPEAELGFYEFRMEITDHETPGVEGDTVVEAPGGTSIEVLNNDPDIEDIKTTRNDVKIGVDTVFIHVNASDYGDMEEFLKIYKIEWRENFSENQNPPTDPWHIDPTKISINLDEGYSPSDYLRASMAPTFNASRTRYDIRVKVEDLDGGISEWVYLMNAFEVIIPEPILFDVTLQDHEVFRGYTVFITLNATDYYDNEQDLTIEIQYRKIGNTWNNIVVTADMYYLTGGYWQIPFSPGLDWLDSQLDLYEFQARVRNSIGLYSNGGMFTRTSNEVEVKNNVPEAESLSASDLTTGQGYSIIIYANGEDRELSEDDLDVEIQYSYDDGNTWESGFINDLDYSFGDGRWEIEFRPGENAPLGMYDFRVRFYDGQDYSDWLIEEDFVDVNYEDPKVLTLGIDKETMSRMETATLTAKVGYQFGQIEDLIPIFEYKSSTGSWISNEGVNNYFDRDPEYIENEWIIEFTPPIDAELGAYSFRVQFFDGTNSSDLKTLPDSLTLINQPPVIEDITVPSTGKRLDPIDIFIDINDPDSPEEGMTVDMEYKSPAGDWMSFDDSQSQFEATYEFVGGQWRVSFVPPAGSELGNYSFRVRISDGDNQTDWFTLTDSFVLSENPEDPDDDGLKNDVDTDDDGDGVLDVDDPDPLDPNITNVNALTNFLLLFLIFLVIIVIVILVTRRRPPHELSKDEEPMEEIQNNEPQEISEEPESEPEETVKEPEPEDVEEDFADRGEEPKSEI